jgi:predicted kinase
VLFRGSSGVGKSFVLARTIPLLARPRKVVRVSRDELWPMLFQHPQFDEAEKLVLDDAVLALTVQLSHSGHVVLVDGCTFARTPVLERFASAHPAVAIIECDCSRATAEARLAADVGRHPIATRGPDLYWQNKLRMEDTLRPVLRIDTDGDADANAAQIAEYIRSRIDFSTL